MDADAVPQRGPVGEVPVLTVTEKQKNGLPGLQQLAAVEGSSAGDHTDITPHISHQIELSAPNSSLYYVWQPQFEEAGGSLKELSRVYGVGVVLLTPDWEILKWENNSG